MKAFASIFSKLFILFNTSLRVILHFRKHGSICVIQGVISIFYSIVEKMRHLAHQ